VKMECGIVKIPSSLGGIAMRSPLIVVALAFAVACGGYAFAADESPQPLTRADCDAAGMTWNDGTNVCGSADTTVAAPDADSSGDMAAAPAADSSGDMAAAPDADSSGDMAAAQPLTRADCDAAGMTWNDGANVCGVESMAAAQPLTRADCEAAGMKWNDGRNVCGSFLASGAAHAHKKEMKKETKKGGTKVIKKVKTSHGVKKTVIHKQGHKQDAAPKKGRFIEWLNGKNKKKP
jgi:hypothetical protein